MPPPVQPVFDQPPMQQSAFEQPMQQSAFEQPQMPQGSVPEPQTAPEPQPELPRVVRGLDLFDQSVAPEPVHAKQPIGTPPPPAAEPVESPFLPPSFEDRGPSAADRFRTSLSSVSHGVLQSMRDIPRSAWRKALLALAAVGILALIVFGCCKLYQMTTPSESTVPGEDPAPKAAEAAVNRTEPKAGTTAKTDAKSKAEAKPKTNPNGKTDPKGKTDGKDKTATATQSAPVKKEPVKLRSTGQKIPTLYVD